MFTFTSKLESQPLSHKLIFQKVIVTKFKQVMVKHV